MKHTPGQWMSENGSDAYLIGTEIHAIGRIYYTSDETGEANANLVKSAPDLLAACEAALRWLNFADFDYSNGIKAFGCDEGAVLGEKGHRELVVNLEAAIARARGEAS